MGTMRDPKWYSAEHRDAWERVKAAFRRDWEQTKADFSKTKGQELDQDVGDTIKQAAGKAPIPPDGVPNADDDWDRVEEGLRYGYAARSQFGGDAEWDERVESRLRGEWSGLSAGRSWDEALGNIRRGWDRAAPGRERH